MMLQETQSPPRHRGRVPLLLIVLLLIGAAACGGGTEGTGVVDTATGLNPENPNAPTDPNAVCGTVTDESGKPVEQLPISSPSTADRTTTDHFGSFVLLLPEPLASDLALTIGRPEELQTITGIVPPAGDAVAVYTTEGRTVSLFPCLDENSAPHETIKP